MRTAILKNLQRVSTAASGRTARATTAVALRPTATRAFASLSAGNMLAEMTKENPHVDVVRYEHKNRKWSLNHVDYYSEALAIGLLETGLQPGDAVLCWLPLHFSESVSL